MIRHVLLQLSSQSKRLLASRTEGLLGLLMYKSHVSGVRGRRSELLVAVGTRVQLLPGVGCVVPGEVFGTNECSTTVIAGITLWTN